VRISAPPRVTSPHRVVRPAPSRQRGLRPLHGATIVLATLLAGVLVVGEPYYVLPVAERVRHPYHAWLRPSGYIGQSAGIVALAIFVFLWAYPLRKKFRWLAFTGAVSRWLDVHVAVALLLPLLVTIHAGWRFGGVIGLGFWAMMIVWSSGLIGRYIYARIPRGRSGVEMDRHEIAAERSRLLDQIAAETGLDRQLVERTLATDAHAVGLGVIGTLRRMIADDRARRRAARRLRELCSTRAPKGRVGHARTVSRAVSLARREMALSQQARLLDATHDLFRYWHVAHRPVAIGALMAVLVHVAVVVAVGATWLW
jgi:hypothetical protein